MSQHLSADPQKSSFKWPVGNAKTGGLSYIHPFIDDIEKHEVQLKKNKAINPWKRNKIFILPKTKKWHLTTPYPNYPDNGVYLSRHVWLRYLAASFQINPSSWQIEKAGNWLHESIRHNPFPSAPFPGQPKAFAWPNHVAMDVYFRICNWLDAWAVGLFAGKKNENIWRILVGELSTYAEAFTEIPEPKVKEGNHYLVEHGLAPLLLAALLPEHPASPKLEKKGQKILKLILDKNFFADGAYAERCLPYSRYVTEHLLIFSAWEEENNLRLLNARERDKIKKHATYFLSLVESNGSIPPIGDGTLESTGDLIRRAKIISGNSYVSKMLVHYPNPGMARLKQGDASVFFSLRGKRLDNYHEHHDILSILMSLGNFRLIDDPASEAYGNDFGVSEPKLRRLIRHHLYSAQAHNIPFPSGQNRPSLKEYGAGYYGTGKWKDLGGYRQFWGGRPPASQRFTSKKTEESQIVRACCEMFSPSVHKRTLKLTRHSLEIKDEVKNATKKWNIIWNWGSKPQVISSSELLFLTDEYEIRITCDGTFETKLNPFLEKVLHHKAPWSSIMTMKNDKAKRTATLLVEWKQRK